MARRPSPAKPSGQELALARACLDFGSVKEAAVTLNLAESTARSYLRSLYGKLRVGSLAQAIDVLNSRFPGWRNGPRVRAGAATRGHGPSVDGTSI